MTVRPLSVRRRAFARCQPALCALLLVTAGVCSPALAQAPDLDSELEVYLITMGPGDHLYTRAGHAALMLAEVFEDGRRETHVYNFGDADWDDPAIPWKFMRGELMFFLSESGTIQQTVRRYGSRLDRSVYRQRVALTQAQARDMAARLAEEAKPENRDYPYHHLRSLCTTRVRDLLNDVLDGTIHTQLALDYDPLTLRQHQRLGSAGIVSEAIAAGFLLGRQHDLPPNRYDATFLPNLMRDYFAQVMVPDPSGSGAEVPLVGPPDVLYARKGPELNTGENRIASWVAAALALLVLLLGVPAALKLPNRSRLAGIWLLVMAIPAGIVGLAALAFVLISTVPEFRHNEFILLLPPTDILLIGPAIRWLRGRAVAGRTLRLYAHGRLTVAALYLLGRLFGVFWQEPIVVALYGATCAVMLFIVIRRMPVVDAAGRPYAPVPG